MACSSSAEKRSRSNRERERPDSSIELEGGAPLVTALWVKLTETLRSCSNRSERFQ